MAVIDYSAGPRITDVGDSIVYTKSTWLDSWVQQPNLVATECQWRAAPEFSSAVLTWRTGYVIMPGDTAPTLFGPWVGRGQFVRIDWQCEDNTILRWVGYIDASQWPTEAFGDQQLVAYGLERSLALTPILDHVWTDGTTLRRSGLPAYFAFDRTKDPTGSVYQFASWRSPPADKEWWSTADVVNYLMTYHLPTSAYGVANIPWSINQGSLLPTWDRVNIDTRGRTVWDVLCELLSPEKQLGFTVGSTGSTAFLRVFTHSSTDIVVGDHTLLANPNQHTVTFAPDALTNASFSDVGGSYDQVIARGARRKTICTLTYGNELEDGWEADEETEYEEAASGEANYATRNTDRQREMNARVRGRYKLGNVYRQFRIKHDWDWQINDVAVLPGNETPLQWTLYLQAPVTGDWSGDVDNSDYIADYAEPLPVLLPNPDAAGKYLEVTRIGSLGDTVTVGNRPHDTSISAEALGRELRLTVHGAPQHAIAADRFTPLPVDLPVGALSYVGMKVTLMIEEDRYVQGIYPASAPSADVVRRLVVDCGDGYQQIRVHAETVAGIDPDGTLETTNDAAYLVDDSPRLATIAQVVALGAVLTRKRVQWHSQRRISTIAVGDMINTAGGATVLAPVTSIRISAPTSINRPASCPTQHFETYAGTQDPLQVLRRLGAID